MADTKISALTSLSGASVAPADDVLAVVDTSVTTTKKISVQALYDAINTLTALGAGSAVAANDYVPVYSASGSATKKFLLSNLPGIVTAGTTLTVAATIATSTKTTQSHGLGAIPTFVVSYLECTSADNGYAVGDRVYNSTGQAGPGTVYGYQVFADSTNTYVSTSSTGLTVTPNGGGTNVAIDLSKWKIVAVPYKVS